VLGTSCLISNAEDKNGKWMHTALHFAAMPR